MAFTKLTEDVNYIQALSDTPNEEEGLTSQELKAEFDKAGNTLKEAHNNLIDELELVESASNIGADKINSNDESGANVQAKLEKLYQDMQDITQGGVADGSINEAKLSSTLNDLLAKRNNELQTGLNAEKIGGSTLESLISYINGGTATGTYIGNTTNSTDTNEIDLGFQPKIIIVAGYAKATIDTTPVTDENGLAIIILNKGKIFFTLGSGSNNKQIADIEITLTETGFILTGSKMNYASKTYNFVAIR